MVILHLCQNLSESISNYVLTYPDVSENLELHSETICIDIIIVITVAKSQTTSQSHKNGSEKFPRLHLSRVLAGLGTRKQYLVVFKKNMIVLNTTFIQSVLSLPSLSRVPSLPSRSSAPSLPSLSSAPNLPSLSIIPSLSSVPSSEGVKSVKIPLARSL